MIISRRLLALPGTHKSLFFTEGETEAQREEALCPSLHGTAWRQSSGPSQTCLPGEHIASCTFLSSPIAYRLVPTMPGPLAWAALQGGQQGGRLQRSQRPGLPDSNAPKLWRHSCTCKAMHFSPSFYFNNWF